MTREPDLRVLNLGAGVQSSTVLLMALAGELPMPDLAVFADTGWEPPAVYSHLAWLEQQAERGGLEVVRVTAGNLRDDALDAEHKFASMPLFIRNPAGGKGILRRQCTQEYKIEPIRREVVRRLGGVTRGTLAELWFGISADEIGRVAQPRVRYTRHFYPLLDLTVDRGPGSRPAPVVTMGDGRGLRMNRNDCIRWLAAAGVQAPRSACIGCPFHSDAEWRAIKQRPDEWHDAVTFDAAIRADGGRVRGQAFLHPSLLPLADVDLSTAEDHGQQILFGDECEGMCGV